MQPEILESRQLLDEVHKRLKRIKVLNDRIEDSEFHTEFLLFACQHRHTFEEQNVTDHKECICVLITDLRIDSAVGSFVIMAERDPILKDSLLMAALKILEND